MNSSRSILDSEGAIRAAIGTTVQRYLDRQGKTASSLAKERYKDLGYKTASSANGALSNFRNGRKLGFGNPDYDGHEFSPRELERLSNLFAVIEIRSDDLLVSRLRKYNPSFKIALAEKRTSIDSASL